MDTRTSNSDICGLVASAGHRNSVPLGTTSDSTLIPDLFGLPPDPKDLRVPSSVATTPVRKTFPTTSHDLTVTGRKTASCFTLNLSQQHLTDSELKLLDRGMTFVPTYFTAPMHSVYALQNRLVRNLKLKDYFRENESDDFDPKVKSFTNPSKWTPADSKVGRSTLDAIQTIVSGTEDLLRGRRLPSGGLVRLHESKDNLSVEERRALKRLRSNQSIVIKPADKGSATVVMDKSTYLTEGYRQLNNTKYYKKLERSIRPDNVARINGILERMNAEGSVSDDQLRYLRANETDRERRFYMLPKIHKPRSKWPQPDRMPEGRPIVSDSGSESCRVAEFIDSFLRPITTRHPAYLKDTYDFVGKIRHVRVPRGAFLVTGDVTSLYTNMTHDRMLSVTRRQFRRYPASGRPDERLLELLDLTLRSNDFVFNGEWYLQICGTAMGKAYAPSLADEYLEEFDDKANGYQVITPTLYRRFLDDVFFVWTGTETELQRFGEYLNSLIEGITVTLTWSQESVNFLDTTVYKSALLDDGTVQLLTRVYFKETDTHQLLHKQSFHPKHCCRGIVKSQMLRFMRIASSRQDYNDACAVLMNALSVRNYNKRLMRGIKAEVWRLPTAPTPDPRPVLPIIVPYNELGCKLARLWKEALCSHEYFGTFRLITAYTIGENLNRKLVHSLVSSGIGHCNTHRLVQSTGEGGCRVCPSVRCKVCKYLTTGTSFTSCRNGKRFTIHESITCKTSNVVYLVTCKRCAMQYVGETSRPLADRVNDHLSCIRLRKKTPVGLHFNLPGHRLTDFSVTGIERFPENSAAEFRKTKETTWQSLLQTAYPLGLNNLKPSHLN